MITLPTIDHIMKGRIKMKGLKKLFSEYTLLCRKGNPLRYDYSQMLVTGYQSGDKFIFSLATDSNRGRDKLQTTELSELLEAMKAYAPAKDWELVKKAED